ncbi:MAG: hypothetical protein WCA20_28165 [Candidatus Sulfotelmatobacter sp.]|jgi:hypothetical protein
MPKFFIEVPHDPDVRACAEVVQVFLTSGSHFLTNAEWGCMDGDHNARIIVELETKQEARSIVPAAFRHRAKVIGLNRFSMEQIDDILSRHRAGS